MIFTAPAGWRQHFGANVVLFEAPGGAGRIRCHERAPLEPLSRVIARALAGDVERWIVDDTSAVVTAEGEYGAFSRITTRTGGEPQIRFVGAVFADEFAVVLEAKVGRAEAAPMLEGVARELLVKVSLGLGVRRRRFVYQPPEGWQAVPNGLVTSWYPPGFPDDHAHLVVFPAEPTAIDPHQELAQMLAAERERGVHVDGEIWQQTLETSGGLVGQTWAFVLRGHEGGALVYRELASFVRAPYRYAIKLDSRGGAHGREHRASFLAVARSVAPIPPAGQPRIGAPHARAASSALGHWVE